MDRNDLSILAAFLAVAEERSFTQAGKRLGVSPSAMSHAIRGLEENVGVRLLSRTTRSVAPTEAGERLLARLRPGLADIQEALDQISELRDKPAGCVRLLVPDLPERLSSDRNWRSLRATIRMWFSISPPTTAALTSLREASMQVSTSASTFRRT
jgi:DNA-binding transcriptional LysR family regulator